METLDDATLAPFVAKARQVRDDGGKVLLLRFTLATIDAGLVEVVKGGEHIDAVEELGWRCVDTFYAQVRRHWFSRTRIVGFYLFRRH